MIFQESRKRLIVPKKLANRISGKPAARLTLSYAMRQKNRQRVYLDNGAEVRLCLPRGTVLRHGDWLETEQGLIIEVQAAAEELSTAFAPTPLLLLRACYHLGKCHVPVQMSENRVSYLQDPVLDEMLRTLGLDVVFHTGGFEAECGLSPAHSQRLDHVSKSPAPRRMRK